MNEKYWSCCKQYLYTIQQNKHKMQFFEWIKRLNYIYFLSILVDCFNWFCFNVSHICMSIREMTGHVTLVTGRTQTIGALILYKCSPLLFHFIVLIVQFFYFRSKQSANHYTYNDILTSKWGPIPRYLLFLSDLTRKPTAKKFEYAMSWTTDMYPVS